MKERGIAPLIIVAVIVAVAVVGGVSIYAITSGGSGGENQPENVGLPYLTEHLNEFENKEVKTAGFVKFYASYYMYEDFWLDEDREGGGTAIPVKVGPLQIPPENSHINVEGVATWIDLEGGFYYLNVNSWTYVA